MVLNLKHKIRVLVSKIREKKKEKRRSSNWSEVRDKFLSLNPRCAACGGTEKLQVHHIVPFHVNETLELDEKNLITLCMGKDECHLSIGHGDLWRCYNPYVKEDAKKYLDSDRHHRSFLIQEVKERRIYSLKE